MNSPSNPDWKTRTYFIGAIAGAVIGFVSALLYTRAAEEDVARGGQPQRIQTGQLLGLALALLPIIRQITDLGAPPTKNNRRR
jgi:hypothetical protein